jgi:adenosine deaminase
MSISSYIEAMPKVELCVQLHGSMKLGTMTILAEQNEISATMKHHANWLKLLDTPDYNRLDELAKMLSSWLVAPDDLTRIVYELAVALHKQNIRYAEVGVDPALYAGLNLPIEGLFEVLNDGRARAEKAWGIKLAWVLCASREDPRRSDELTRWGVSLAARKAGVVALGINGRESLMAVGQFERAFKSAEKKGLARVARAGDDQSADGVQAALDTLAPNRIIDGRGIADNAVLQQQLVEQNVVLSLSVTRAVKHKWVAQMADYPLAKLYKAGITIVLGQDMPTFYKNSLNSEYVAAVENGLLSIEDIDDVSLAGVNASFLTPDEKEAMVAEFRETYAKLRSEHLVSQAG